MNRAPFLIKFNNNLLFIRHNQILSVFFFCSLLFLVAFTPINSVLINRAFCCCRSFNESRYKLLTEISAAAYIFRDFYINPWFVPCCVYFACTLFVYRFAKVENSTTASTCKAWRKTSKKGDRFVLMLFIVFWILPSNVIASKIRLRRRNVRWQCHHKCFALYLFYWIKIHLRLFSMNPPLRVEIAGVLVLKFWNDLCFKHGWLKGHVIAVALSVPDKLYIFTEKMCQNGGNIL